MRPGKDRPRPPFIASSVNLHSSNQVRVRENNKQHDREIFLKIVSFYGFNVRQSCEGRQLALQWQNYNLTFLLIISKYFQKTIPNFLNHFGRTWTIFRFNILPINVYLLYRKQLISNCKQCPVSTYLDNSRLVHLITLLAFKVSAICDLVKYQALIAKPSHHLNFVQPGWRLEKVSGACQEPEQRREQSAGWRFLKRHSVQPSCVG